MQKTIVRMGILLLASLSLSFCNKEEKKSGGSKNCPASANQTGTQTGTQTNQQTSTMAGQDTQLTTTTETSTSLSLTEDVPTFAKITEILNRHYVECEAFQAGDGELDCANHTDVSADFDKILRDLVKLETVPLEDLKLLFIRESAGKPNDAQPVSTNPTNTGTSQTVSDPYANPNQSDANMGTPGTTSTDCL